MTNILRTSAFFPLLFAFAGVASAQLLVSDRGSNQITKYDPVTGEYLGVLVSNDATTNGGLFFPSALSLGPNDELLVATQLGDVLRYDLDSGDFKGKFASELSVPSGLLYDEANDELFVSTLGNFNSDLVLRYRASTGELLSEIGQGTGQTGRTSMTFGPDGNFYVSSFADETFFLGSVLQFDGDTFESNGTFAALVPAQQTDPFLGGSSGLVFRDGADEGEFELDVVGLFSSNVVRFGIVTTEDGLVVNEASPIVSSGLVFPSAIQDHQDGETILISNLGNDDPMQGELQPGWIGRYDARTGEFLEKFIDSGGEGNISQPNALLRLPAEIDFDCNGDGVVDSSDLNCGCSVGLDVMLAELNLIAGDFDANGEVAFIDFLVLADNFGNPGSYVDGDMNCDGNVEFLDFLDFAMNFGRSSAVASSIPEPNAMLTLVLGVGLLIGFRRRR